jgi:hypothetical protein
MIFGKPKKVKPIEFIPHKEEEVKKKSISINTVGNGNAKLFEQAVQKARQQKANAKPRKSKAKK